MTSQPVKDPDPRHDSKYIDNLDEYEVRVMLLWADRYTVAWNGGTVTIFNPDIDFTRHEKLLEVTDVASSHDDAIKNAYAWDDVALEGGYARPYSFYRLADGVIVPTVFSPETAPRVFETMMLTNRDIAKTASEAEDFFRGQRNGLIIGMVAGGVLRFAMGGFSGGSGGTGGGGDVPLPKLPTPDSISDEPVTTPQPTTAKADPVDPVQTEPAPAPASIRDRLAEFYRRLRGLPRANTADQALTQVRDTLDGVENDLSGVAKKTPPPAPNKPDGRMYPPLDDYVTRNEDGSLSARTRGHRIEIGKDGSITIKNIKSGDVEFYKP